MIEKHIYAVEHYRAEHGKTDQEDTIESLNTKLARLKDLYVDGLIDKETYRVDYAKLQERVAKAACRSGK